MELETSERKAQYVAPVEWDSAITHAVAQAFEIDKASLVSDVLGLLGFKRATSGATEIVELRINDLARRRVLEGRNGLYRVV